MVFCLNNPLKDNKSSLKVMVAGVGGASLGTEICKSLLLVDRYEIFGCDISPTAYGLHEESFSRTYLVNREHYLDNVIEACLDSGAGYLIPGGEQPMALLGAASSRLHDLGIEVVTNTPEVIALFSDKDATFTRLAEHGIKTPRTKVIEDPSDVDVVGLPCIVKPATGSGGSASVFFATSADEAMVYAQFIRRGGSQPLAQEYIDDGEGEFTIGGRFSS